MKDEAWRLERVSRLRGLAAELREGGLDDAADTAELSARILYRARPRDEKASFGEDDGLTAAMVVEFVLMDSETYRFRVTDETQDALAQAVGNLEPIPEGIALSFSEGDEFVDIPAVLFDLFTRNLGVHGACVQDARLHSSWLPLSSVVKERYFGGVGESLRPSDEEPAEPLTSAANG